MNINRVLSSEWLRYRNSQFFYLYVMILITIPFLIRRLNTTGPDETILLAIVSLVITVLAATEIPRLAESGILRAVLLSNISREYFYISHLMKYIVVYCFSFFIGTFSLLLVFKEPFNFEWILDRFFVYLIIILLYISFSQFLSILFRRTVESLMTSLLVLFVVVPIFNSFYSENSFYKKLPFLYIEPKNLLLVESTQFIYAIFILLCCSVITLFLGIKKMQKTEV